MTFSVDVSLSGHRYPIHIGPGLLSNAGALLTPVLRSPRVLIVADPAVGPAPLATLTASLQASGMSCGQPIMLTGGEASKTLAGYETLTTHLLEQGADRKTTLIALGGGVIGDLAGFAAATVMRGMDFVQVPSTLLAQVDSSVGGKTGINTRHGKNLLGAFHQPIAVLADIALLATLPRRELLAGYAEVLKYGLIDDAPFYDWCEQTAAALIAGDETARSHAITQSCRAKARIVGQDEKESGPRMLLNLGHTFGHALEAQAGYDGRLLHGEGVAVGMVMACRLSARLGLCAPELASRLQAHLRKLGLPASLNETVCATTPATTLLEHMQHDKKTDGGKLTFVLLRGIGQAVIARDIPPEQVLPILEKRD